MSFQCQAISFKVCLQSCPYQQSLLVNTLCFSLSGRFQTPDVFQAGLRRLNSHSSILVGSAYVPAFPSVLTNVSVHQIFQQSIISEWLRFIFTCKAFLWFSTLIYQNKEISKVIAS